MLNELQVLILTAISIACLHTMAGPDHYLPFIALSRARGWTVRKTIGWTIVCGSGHILSSVLLGLAGAGLGWSVSKLNWVEGMRGGLAGWVMLSFGAVYTCWGLRVAYLNKPHKHFDLGAGKEVFVYEHQHGEPVTPPARYRLTPWVLFVIFILGPCEPMIPLLYYPGAQNNLAGMTVLILVYLIVTLVTMICMVLLGFYGIRIINVQKMERYVHALGGLTILICGVGMLWLEW